MSKSCDTLRLEGFGTREQFDELQEFCRNIYVRDPATGDCAINHFALAFIGTRMSAARKEKGKPPVHVLSGNAHPTTSDGYTWRAALYFAVEGGKVAILFPWLEDVGTEREHQVSVFVNNVSRPRVQYLLVQFLIQTVLAISGRIRT